MTNMATPLQKHPCSRGYGIYNFGKPSLAHHMFILLFVLSMLSWREEESIFTKRLIRPRPSTRTPAPRGHKFTILVHRVNHYYTHCLIYVKIEKTFKEIKIKTKIIPFD